MVGNNTNEHAPKHVFNNSRHLGHRVGGCMGIDVKPRALSPSFFRINCIEKDVKGTTMSLEKSSTGKVKVNWLGISFTFTMCEGQSEGIQATFESPPVPNNL